MIFGFSHIDCEQSVRTRAMTLSIPDVTPSEFQIQMASFNGCNAYGISCSWMTLPDDLHLESGSIDTHGTGEMYHDHFTQRVVFGQRFASPPKICTWLQEFDYTSDIDGSTVANTFTSLFVRADNINEHSFTLHIGSWANRKFRNARAGWFAYPSEEDGKRVKSGRDRVTSAETTQQKKAPFYGQPFSRTPATFIAISEIDFAGDSNLRMTSTVKALNNQEMEWSFGTWGISIIDHADITWIALE